jgi:ABC-2 type transport system ATP-binding protein
VPEPVVSVANLTKRFGEVVAVRDLGFNVSRGEVLGLLGANGAGKTTTIQLLLGLTTPDEGSIRIFGLDPAKHRLEILRRLNFSSAYIALPSNLTVRENLEVFARLYAVADRKRKIREVLDLFEIPGIERRVTGQLSSGQTTRLNLCKAFLNDPELLLLDEPTASLDPDIAEKVRRALADAQRERGVTIIYTSHNMAEVELMCDRVIFLARGRIVAAGTPQDVVDQSSSATLEELFISIARGGDVVDTTRE